MGSFLQFGQCSNFCLCLDVSAEDPAFILIAHAPRMFCDNVYIQQAKTKARLVMPGRP